MKINYAFLHGFTTNEKAKTPLVITGDEKSITLTKGEVFDAWFNDRTRLSDGSTYRRRNLKQLDNIIQAWLKGEEFDG